MKKSSKAGAKESGRNLALIQQLKDLEKDWESLKKSNLRNTRRCSTGSVSDSSHLITSFGQLLENSPKGLMYSLQHRRPSPSDGFLRVKNSCDMAVQEILWDRRAAIMSGKVKGRRLFGQVEGPSEVELDLNYDDMMQETEVVMSENSDGGQSRGEEDLPDDAFSLSCSVSDTEEKEVVEEEEKTVVEVVEKRRSGGCCGSSDGGGGRCIVAMSWLAFLLILLILGLISMSCNGKSVHENELKFLVPT